MNEQITILALKASDPKTGWLDRQKFAELIIRECADIATMNQFQWDSAGGYVLKHFGVEK
jgi:hypothetical protein